jgi:hypothetical protein
LEDVPAADTFTVDDALEVTALPSADGSSSSSSSVTVTISFQVTFVKSTFLRAMIESPTNSEMKKWMAAFFEALKRRCAEANSTSKASAPGGNGKAAETNDVAAPVIVAAAPAPKPAAPLQDPGRSMLHALCPVIAVLLLLMVFMRLGAIEKEVAKLTDAVLRMEALFQQAIQAKP